MRLVTSTSAIGTSIPSLQNDVCSLALADSRDFGAKRLSAIDGRPSNAVNVCFPRLDRLLRVGTHPSCGPRRLDMTRTAKGIPARTVEPRTSFLVWRPMRTAQAPRVKSHLAAIQVA
jgi:hypothetical protein